MKEEWKKEEKRKGVYLGCLGRNKLRPNKPLLLQPPQIDADR